MAWRLAKALVRLKDQVNAAAPTRNKVSDGGIGNAEHASRASDHNPWIKINGMGVVSAYDTTHDPSGGVDGSALSESLTKDSRSKYIIFAGRIWKARTGKWETYRGPNSHHHHVHVSVKPESVDNDSPWTIELGGGMPPAPVPPSRPVLKLGSKGQEVRILQSKLGIEIDGQFGYGTQKAVMQFQEKHGLEVDGKVGKATWAKLG